MMRLEADASSEGSGGIVRRKRTPLPLRADGSREGSGRAFRTELTRTLDDCDFPITWTRKIMESKMSLTYSHRTSQRPMYKGLKAREGHSLSLTSPSRFYLQALTSCKRIRSDACHYVM